MINVVDKKNQGGYNSVNIKNKCNDGELKYLTHHREPIYAESRYAEYRHLTPEQHL